MSTLYLKVSKDWKENFTGYSAISIIVSTCLGSFGIMTTMMNEKSLSQFVIAFLIVAACGVHNASILTVQKPDTVLNLFITSIIISVAVIVTNLILI